MTEQTIAAVVDRDRIWREAVAYIAAQYPADVFDDFSVQEAVSARMARIVCANIIREVDRRIADGK